MWSELGITVAFGCTGFLAYNFLSIMNFVFNLIALPPGTGKIYRRTDPKTKKRQLFVDTNCGTVRVPYIKLPSVDSELYFFTKQDAVQENQIMTITDFKEKFKGQETFNLKRYDTGVITDIIKPSDYMNYEQICGYIFSMFEDVVYVFVIKDNYIDYEKLFEDYDDALAHINFEDLSNEINENDKKED